MGEQTAMSYKLYRGVWPQNVSRLAKYNVRFVEKDWRVTVWCDMGDGLRYFAVDGDRQDLAQQVNAVKQSVQDQPGGIFYINEYRHVIVPVSRVGTSAYYCAGTLQGELCFAFEGSNLTSRPVTPAGLPLNPGDSWIGPRPGIPYVLAAGASDIYYETPALTDADPPELRPGLIRKVQLTKVLNNRDLVSRAVKAIATVRGHAGGRFYVNEHGAIFSPIDKGDGNGINYVYCGTIDRSAWFPEPVLS